MRCLVTLVGVVVGTFLWAGGADGRIINIETDSGAKAGDDAWDTVIKNGGIFNTTLKALQPGDTLVVPNKTFYIMGGIKASHLRDVTIQIDGTIEYASTALNFHKYIAAWPRNTPGSDGNTLECMSFKHLTNVTFTSTGEGTLDGSGGKWWGFPGIGYLMRAENRPRLLKIQQSKDILIDRIFFKNSPYWTFLASGVKNIEVRHSRVDNRRDTFDSHTKLDETAFNTDGFDFGACDNVWVHDCSVWNQDDCFDVKDGTSNVVIERVNASGFGLTIGSIASVVRNITFRDAYMHHTVKGIYLKFRGAGRVEDVTYENIVMDAPEQFGIWIGPAQQCDGCNALNICSTDGGPCSLCWPEVPGTECHAPAGGQYTNITLRNITINNPAQSAGVLLANETSAMVNVVFDNVVVNNPASKPFGEGQYYCKNVQGVAIGNTHPVPPCMKDLTNKHNVSTSILVD